MDYLKMKVEIPKGSTNKYEFNERTGEWELDRVLYGSMFYPEEYGYVENTIDYDGDPLDVICLVSSPTFHGCTIPIKIIGVLKMIDQGQDDYKLIAVNNVDPRFFHINNLKEIGHKLEEIENFFLRYKELEKKDVQINGYGEKNEAFAILDKCRKMFLKCKDLFAQNADKHEVVKFLNSQKQRDFII